MRIADDFHILSFDEGMVAGIIPMQGCLNEKLPGIVRETGIVLPVPGYGANPVRDIDEQPVQILLAIQLIAIELRVHLGIEDDVRIQAFDQVPIRFAFQDVGPLQTLAIGDQFLRVVLLLDVGQVCEGADDQTDIESAVFHQELADVFAAPDRQIGKEEKNPGGPSFPDLLEPTVVDPMKMAVMVKLLEKIFLVDRRE